MRRMFWMVVTGAVAMAPVGCGAAWLRSANSSNAGPIITFANTPHDGCSDGMHFLFVKFHKVAGTSMMDEIYKMLLGLRCRSGAAAGTAAARAAQLSLVQLLCSAPPPAEPGVVKSQLLCPSAGAFRWKESCQKTAGGCVWDFENQACRAPGSEAGVNVSSTPAVHLCGGHSCSRRIAKHFRNILIPGAETSKIPYLYSVAIGLIIKHTATHLPTPIAFDLYPSKLSLLVFCTLCSEQTQITHTKKEKTKEQGASSSSERLSTIG